MEVIVVVILIGVLAALAMPLYHRASEGSRNKEATAMLNLIGEAERMYKLEYGKYFNCPSISSCNANLSLNLPEGNDQSWNYSVNAGASDFNVTADRTNVGFVDGGRSWYLQEADDDPVCSGDDYCNY